MGSHLPVAEPAHRILPNTARKSAYIGFAIGTSVAKSRPSGTRTCYQGIYTVCQSSLAHRTTNVLPLASENAGTV